MSDLHLPDHNQQPTPRKSIPFRLGPKDTWREARLSPTDPTIAAVSYMHASFNGRLVWSSDGSWTAQLFFPFDYFGQKFMADAQIGPAVYREAQVTCVEEAIAVTGAVAETLGPDVIAQMKVGIAKMQAGVGQGMTSSNGHHRTHVCPNCGVQFAEKTKPQVKPKKH